MNELGTSGEQGVNFFWYSQSSLNELDLSCERDGHELFGTIKFARKRGDMLGRSYKWTSQLT